MPNFQTQITFSIQMLEKTKVGRLDTLTETQDHYCACFILLYLKYLNTFLGANIFLTKWLLSWLERLLINQGRGFETCRCILTFK